jgi:hypothetical protein
VFPLFLTVFWESDVDNEVKGCEDGSFVVLVMDEVEVFVIKLFFMFADIEHILLDSVLGD